MFLTLMYHIINRMIDAKIAISEEAFEAQLDYLGSNGYTIISLAQAIDITEGRLNGVHRPILITFDDGYSDTVEAGLPLLLRHGMTATLFMTSAYIGQLNRWNPRASYDVRHLSWHDLQLWIEAGCDLGGHSHAHLCMTRLNEPELHEAVAVNKQILEDNLRLRLRAFAYPYGSFNKPVREVVKKYYETAFSVDDGVWNATADRYAINRLGVSPKWSVDEFGRHLEELFSGALCMNSTIQ